MNKKFFALVLAVVAASIVLCAVPSFAAPGKAAGAPSISARFGHGPGPGFRRGPGPGFRPGGPGPGFRPAPPRRFGPGPGYHRYGPPPPPPGRWGYRRHHHHHDDLAAAGALFLLGAIIAGASN